MSMLNVWNVSSGTRLDILQEGEIVDTLLPIVESTNVSFKKISGNLPKGLTLLSNGRITGTVAEVALDTTFVFVVRATDENNEISDRALNFLVQGPDAPRWITPAGLLPVNPNGLYYVLDNTYVDYQLEVLDTDIAAGDVVEYFIESGNGQLPPGLTLTSNGRITGLIDPIVSLQSDSGSGYFDTSYFSTDPFDFGQGPINGVDSFNYDSYGYDYSNTVKTPKKLNRYFEFIVSASDGDTVSRRKFRIYLVGDDFLRADNAIMKVDTGMFTADNTYLRPPVWLTPPDLGIKRANNNVTVFLEAFDPVPYLGPVSYEVATPIGEWTANKEYKKNQVVSYLGKEYICIASHTSSPTFSSNSANWIVQSLPAGLYIDSTNGELYGFVPYQPAITKTFNFLVNAIKYDTKAYTQVEIVIGVAEFAPYGQNFLKIDPLSDDDVVNLVGGGIRIGNSYYKVTSYEGPAITLTSYAYIRLDKNLLTNVNKNTTIVRTFIKSTIEYSTVVGQRLFTIKILGEVESTIRWNTGADLGVIRVNIPSRLSVSATTSVTNAILKYTLLSGELPPGLELSTNGDIIGIIRADANLNKTVYQAEIQATDQFGYSAISEIFTITVNKADDRLYSNIYVRPYQNLALRDEYRTFITNNIIFSPEKIYRITDPNFGVQVIPKMLMYAGIETVNINEYVEGLVYNTKRKRYKLGNAKKAIAKEYGSNNIVYEVIYIEVLEEYEEGKLSAPAQVITSNGATYYPSSTKNMRENLKNVTLDDSRAVLTENEFLPLWMLTPQDNRTAATGYVKAIPLCYCKPGEADYILLNIKNSGFDFTNLDFDVDRYIIDRAYSDTGEYIENQFLKFDNSSFNV